MELTLGSQIYPWYQHYRRAGKQVEERLDEALADVAAAGLEAWEQSLDSDEQADALAPLLRKHGLRLTSIYAGGRLCDEHWRDAATRIVDAGERAKALGASIVVSNPAPLHENGAVCDKTDAQLRTQATALRWLTERLHDMGLTLAYHTHEPEMRCAAREFHHMMLATGPTRGGAGDDEPSMALCCDAHWLFRGAGDSNVAFADLVELYGDRIASLHLRQSHRGVWTEALDVGADLDYAPLIATLREIDFAGPAMIETAFEPGTPTDLDLVESHRRSAEWIRQHFTA